MGIILKEAKSEMGLNEILFYIWFVISITALFYILSLIIEYFIPKIGNLINKLKNYFKGGVL